MVRLAPIWRSAIVSALAGAALTLPAGATGLPTATVTAVPELSRALVTAVNAARTARGLAPLSVSAGLTAAARAHAKEMIERGYFGHDAFPARIRRYYPPGAARRWAAGENLAWGRGALTPAAVVRMWLQSPAHRALLLSRVWREVGVAAAHSPEAPGVYGGQPTTIVAAEFGVRRS